MIASITRAAAIAAALILTPAAASAQQIYESVTGDDLVEILTEVGYTAELGVDNVGEPMINGQIEGVAYTLFFYRCNDETPKQCLDLQFNSEFAFQKPVTLEMVNAYNTNNRFGQAYIDKDGRTSLDMSVTVQGGLTRQAIKENIDWWKVALTSFEEKIFETP